MKKFKKIAAAAVAAVMVFSLAACGSKDGGVVADSIKELEKLAEEEVTLTGEWESDPINMIDSFVEGADEELKSQLGSDVSIRDYVTEFNLQCHLVFSEDDTFQLSYDIDTDKDQLRAEFSDYMRAIFNDMSGRELTEEELTEKLGMSVEEYAAEAWSDEAIDAAFPENMITGTYTNEDGKITISTEEGEFSSGTFEGGVLTLEDSTLGNLVFAKAE